MSFIEHKFFKFKYIALCAAIKTRLLYCIDGQLCVSELLVATTMNPVFNKCTVHYAIFCIEANLQHLKLDTLRFSILT